MKPYNYSMNNMFKEYYNNSNLIESYVKSRSHEGFTSTRIMGLTISMFLVVFALTLALWVWSIWAIIKYWDMMSDFAKIVGVLGLVFGIPVVTLIAVYASKGGGYYDN